MKKYTYDISLDEGVGSRLISWVTGLMVFFVTLALAVNFGLSAVTKNWVTGLSGTLTVEIRSPASDAAGKEKKRFNDSVRQVMTMLKNDDAVSEARLLTTAEIKSLIEPWLGQGMDKDTLLDSLPLPALIAVKLAPDSDIAQLQSDLKTLAPSAVIDSHTDTLDDLQTLVNTATLFMLLLTGVIVLLAMVAISGMVRAKLLIHRSEVETLHLIGASDEYIARQFRQHTLRGTLKGALTGITCTFITLLVIGAVTRTLDTDIIPHFSLMPVQWSLLIIAPLVAGSLIAHLTAQATVLRELAKLP